MRRTLTAATVARREAEWESRFIQCRNHPDRRCNRFAYAWRAVRYCGSCKSTYRADGTRAAAHQRFDASEQRLWSIRSRRLYIRIRERAV